MGQSHLSPLKILGQEADQVILFEDIYTHTLCILDLQNTMGILEKTETSTYIVVDTEWDTTSPTFYKFIYKTIKKRNICTDQVSI